MHIPIHSPWLPGYIDVAKTILIILTVTWLFLDGPCTSKAVKEKLACFLIDFLLACFAKQCSIMVKCMDCSAILPRVNFQAPFTACVTLDKLLRKWYGD